MIARSVPGALSSVWTLAAITLNRLGRGKALWIGLLIAALRVLYAGLVRGRLDLASPDRLFQSSMPLLALLPAVFVGASIGEELDDHTSTYVWSRPIARWAVLAGKLCALTPIVLALIVGSWYAAIELATQAAPSAISCLALAAGAVATSLVAAGIATVMPRHGRAMTIGYLLVDIFVGLLPFSLSELSITHQVHVLARLTDDAPAIAMPLIAMAVVSGVWAAIGFVRIGRLEA